jgi:hypothetical protein
MKHLALRGAQAGRISNGNVAAAVSAAGLITITRLSDGAELLSGPLPGFTPAQCGHGYHTFATNFSVGGSSSGSANNRWYGLGQLGAANAKGQRNCGEGSGECVVPLERSQRGPVQITSVKFWIAIPWLYNRNGWGVLFNQPGDGVVDVSQAGQLSANFSCQKQLDLWVVAAPVPGAADAALAVYNSYARATGMPSPLPDNAALCHLRNISIWQLETCRD